MSRINGTVYQDLYLFYGSVNLQRFTAPDDPALSAHRGSVSSESSGFAAQKRPDPPPVTDTHTLTNLQPGDT